MGQVLLSAYHPSDVGMLVGIYMAPASPDVNERWNGLLGPETVPAAVFGLAYRCDPLCFTLHQTQVLADIDGAAGIIAQLTEQITAAGLGDELAARVDQIRTALRPHVYREPTRVDPGRGTEPEPVTDTTV